eukprot:CAMPEP_0198499158 /NCGR_PEP_ID=MMETSP1462-20131121/7445_1 /TAXON_ID=1333877 /ORGANISM="Brandtodinium nutriculum, Strain RCC3387" /LENGTH=36 /DNA_ID= /DNA_START= /DNA_END= /DNA_ORIENTATION=
MAVVFRLAGAGGIVREVFATWAEMCLGRACARFSET